MHLFSPDPFLTPFPFSEIRATGFAGQVFEKPETDNRCSFSPVEKVRMRASVNTISIP